MTNDEKYILRCIQLAKNGILGVSPNPMVGAVIVYQGRIIGEGYHIRYGEAHAEVNAIRSVKGPTLLQDSTLYVSLEPCSHYGKTPPCAELIIAKGIPRVVIGCIDPFSLVAGRGIARLKEAGIDVTVGVMENECRRLIERFIQFNTSHRPYITLKWAESSDGFMDVIRENGHPVKLSSPVSSVYVHKLRAEHKAILVGYRTALLDNPSLTCRLWSGENPLRLVIDRHLTLPSHLHLFDRSTPTWVFTQERRQSEPNLTFQQLDFKLNILPQITDLLYKAKVQSLLVEGGAKTLQEFLRQNMWDEIFIEHADKALLQGVKAPAVGHGHAAEYCIHADNLVTHFKKDLP